MLSARLCCDIEVVHRGISDNFEVLGVFSSGVVKGRLQGLGPTKPPNNRVILIYLYLVYLHERHGIYFQMMESIVPHKTIRN